MPSFRTFIALGSNQGSRLTHLREAALAIADHFEILGSAWVYRTEAMYRSQPDFLNTAIEALTTIPASDVLETLLEIESSLGRTRTVRYGPRSIDIDLIIHGNTVLRSERAEVPHPRFAERPFVLKPLVDLAPDFRDPITGQRFDSLNAACPTWLRCDRVFAPSWKDSYG